MNPKDIVNKVGADRIRKAMESNNGDELKALFESEGIFLTPEQMDYISGGVVIEQHPTTPRGGSGGSGQDPYQEYADDGTDTCEGSSGPSDPFSTCEDPDPGDTL